MASLLERAQIVREKLGEEEIINSIPEKDRRKIYEEIDRAVAANRLRVNRDTFSFKTKRHDGVLPFFINFLALLLIVGLGYFFYSFFNEAETSITSPDTEILNTEGSIIQALKEESEEKLAEKNREIQSILGRLDSARFEQQRLVNEAREEAERIEADLRRLFEQDLEKERQRLQAEGLSETALDRRLKEFEAIKQEELQNRLDAQLAEIRETNLERENVLKEQIAEYEQGIEQARIDLTALEAELQEQYSEQNRQTAAERDEALDRLRSFDEQQKQEQLVVDQIFGMYSSTNEAIKESRYDEALKNLENLSSFLQQEKIASLPAIAYRREVDTFMIRSLRRLIETEKTQTESTGEAAPTSVIGDTAAESNTEETLAKVADLVEKGNELFEEGEMENAREYYLNALSQVPALDSGFNRLRSIDELSLQEERNRFRETLNEGDRYMNSRELETGIEKYRQALEYLESDSDVVNRLINQLIGAGKELHSADEQPLISAEELELLNRAKMDMEERRAVLAELYELERNYSSDSSIENTDAAASSEAAGENLASLLNTKLLIREVLASDSIRSEYPDLHEKMGQYLEAYGKEKEREGRDAALSEIIQLMEHLSEGKDRNGPAPSDGVDAEQRKLFLEFLQNLKNILEMNS